MSVFLTGTGENPKPPCKMTIPTNGQRIFAADLKFHVLAERFGVPLLGYIAFFSILKQLVLLLSAYKKKIWFIRLDTFYFKPDGRVNFPLSGVSSGAESTDADLALALYKVCCTFLFFATGLRIYPSSSDNIKKYLRKFVPDPNNLEDRLSEIEGLYSDLSEAKPGIDYYRVLGKILVVCLKEKYEYTILKSSPLSVSWFTNFFDKIFGYEDFKKIIRCSKYFTKNAPVGSREECFEHTEAFLGMVEVYKNLKP